MNALLKEQLDLLRKKDYRKLVSKRTGIGFPHTLPLNPGRRTTAMQSFEDIEFFYHCAFSLITELVMRRQQNDTDDTPSIDEITELITQVQTTRARSHIINLENGVYKEPMINKLYFPMLQATWIVEKLSHTSNAADNDETIDARSRWAKWMQLQTA